MFVPIIFTWLRVRTKRTMSTADLVLALTLGTLPARALGLVHLFASSLVVSSCLTAGGLSDMCLCEGELAAPCAREDAICALACPRACDVVLCCTDRSSARGKETRRSWSRTRIRDLITHASEQDWRAVFLPSGAEPFVYICTQSHVIVVKRPTHRGGRFTRCATCAVGPFGRGESLTRFTFIPLRRGQLRDGGDGDGDKDDDARPSCRGRRLHCFGAWSAPYLHVYAAQYAHTSRPVLAVCCVVEFKALRLSPWARICHVEHSTYLIADCDRERGPAVATGALVCLDRPVNDRLLCAVDLTCMAHALRSAGARVHALVHASCLHIVATEYGRASMSVCHAVVSPVPTTRTSAAPQTCRPFRCSSHVRAHDANTDRWFACAPHAAEPDTQIHVRPFARAEAARSTRR